MELGIRGKLALVVGASKNIGAATVAELRAEGANVIGVARSPTSGRDLGCDYYAYDLMPAAGVESFLQMMIGTYGAPDIIVHSLGGSNGITDTWLPSSEWAKVWRLNLGIAHDLNRAFVPSMIIKGWGRIVHFSSVATTAHIGYCPYASAKHAVEGYVKNVSKEVSKHGVVISCVRPGAFPYAGRHLAELAPADKRAFIENYIPAGRFGEARECARVVTFLCSDAASYMAGAIVAADGGHR